MNINSFETLEVIQENAQCHKSQSEKKIQPWEIVSNFRTLQEAVGVLKAGVTHTRVPPTSFGHVFHQLSKASPEYHLPEETTYEQSHFFVGP